MMITAGKYFDNDRFFPGELPAEAFDAQALAKRFGISHVDAAAQVVNNRRAQVWINSKYQVLLRRIHAKPSLCDPDLLHLSIRRLDRQPIHDWRDLQEIKNALVGEEFEGIEIYPAESRRADTSNQYHLWVVDDPTFRIPFGFADRLVMDDPPGGAVQRPVSPPNGVGDYEGLLIRALCWIGSHPNAKFNVAAADRRRMPSIDQMVTAVLHADEPAQAEFLGKYLSGQFETVEARADFDARR